MKYLLRVVLAFTAIFLIACASDTTVTATSTALETVPAEFAGQTNPYGVEAATSGAEIYQSYCATCHGETGLGDGVAGASLVPPPKNLMELQAQVQDDYLFWRIHEGKSGTAMVAWKGILTDEQIWQVVSFLRTLK
jgi:mono/diheme cytochrome c family protein